MNPQIPRLTRRCFLTAPLAAPVMLSAQGAPSYSDDAFPSHSPDIAREFVVAAHGNLARVKEMVGKRPALAKAGIDWGFGDWETALDGASHIGNRDIAEYLIANGARPTIFSAAMLGQVDVVKAHLAAAPGVERVKGAHGINLMRHAMAGGARAQAVVDYLKAFPGADERITTVPLTAEQAARLAGTYVFGSGATEHFEVGARDETLSIKRPPRIERGLSHLGSLEFSPAGAPAVRLRFSETPDGVSLTVVDGDVLVTARKS